MAITGYPCAGNFIIIRHKGEIITICLPCSAVYSVRDLSIESPGELSLILHDEVKPERQLKTQRL